MVEKNLHDTFQGFIFGQNGKIHHLQELTFPFISNFANELRETGFEKELDNPKWHKPIVNEFNPRADLGLTPILIVLGISIGSSIGSWAVGKFCDFLWGKTKNAFVTLKERYKKVEKAQGEPVQINFSIEVHYDNDNLSVHVDGIATSLSEIDSIERLVPEAQKKAFSWVKKNGIKSSTMRFTIKNGELSEFPRLDEE